MSGFEIAGVVLGSLPLIISAMEHYADGIATAKRFWRYKSEMRSLILQINTERGIFINTLEQLLTGIVRVEHMADFLTNPGEGVWQDAEVESKLKGRLRSAYQIYIDNVRGMEVSLKKMMEKLALDKDGKPQFNDPNAFKQEIKRLKFSISKAEYQELLTNLKNYNQALTRLTKQSIELEPTRAESKSRCPNFRVVQNYARSLYTTLRAGWRCGCPGHEVNLRLENRNKFEEGDVTEQIPFRIVFSYTADNSSPTTSPFWREADVRFIEDKPESIPLSLSRSNQNITPISSTKRRVRFEQVQLQVRQKTVATAPLSYSTTATSTIASASYQSPTSHPTPQEIQDLCKAIAKLQQLNQIQQPYRDICIGYLPDSLNKLKHGIYPLEPPATTHQQWAAYSLKDVLACSPKIARRLTQHDKLRVAVDLASSVLQLYKTPWLDEDWGKDDVYFIHRPGAPTASIYEHPFVCRKFTAHPHSHLPSNTHCPTLQRAASKVIRNQRLFMLGLLLIELWYGKSIEELQEPCDLDCAGTPGVAWCTADRLVENEIEFEAGKRYSDAVRRCIRCDFDRRDMSLDSEGFQQAVYDGVVALLERTLEQFNRLD